jgi:hypothetical protein
MSGSTVAEIIVRSGCVVNLILTTGPEAAARGRQADYACSRTRH